MCLIVTEIIHADLIWKEFQALEKVITILFSANIQYLFIITSKLAKSLRSQINSCVYDWDNSWKEYAKDFQYPKKLFY